MAFRHLLLGITAKHWKATIFLFMSLLTVFRFDLMAQGGLKSIMVEKTPVSSEALQNDPNLVANSFAYRVFAEMDTAYELQAVFGLDNHPLIIKTNTHFYNNNDFGGTAGKDLLSALFAVAPALFFDSYITIGAASNNSLGILISEDSLDGKADGLVAGSALPLQNVGDDFSVPFGTENFPGTFKTNSGIYSVIGGEQGPAKSNRVLIGQFTTDGDFSFELNIQIRPLGSNLFEQYVARDPKGEEIYFPGLTWPENTPPVVSLTNPLNGSRIKTGELVQVEASASDPDTVTSVKFLLNGSTINTDTVAPFKFDWTATGDTARFSAIATDGMGLSDTSNVVEVLIGSFAPPLISLSAPQESDSFLLGHVIPILANASDADGNIIKVEFYSDHIKIGEDLTSPYELNWTPESAGDKFLFALATDDDSLKTSSDTISVNILSISGLHYLNSSPETLTIYPNPAEKNVSLSLSGLEANLYYRLEVVGINGQVYLNTTIRSQDGSYMHKLDVSSLSKGVYQLRLTNGNFKSLSGKLIIK
jgi:hypothetical protein